MEEIIFSIIFCYKHLNRYYKCFKHYMHFVQLFFSRFGEIILMHPFSSPKHFWRLLHWPFRLLHFLDKFPGALIWHLLNINTYDLNFRLILCVQLYIFAHFFSLLAVERELIFKTKCQEFWKKKSSLFKNFDCYLILIVATSQCKESKVQSIINLPIMLPNVAQYIFSVAHYAFHIVVNKIYAKKMGSKNSENHRMFIINFIQCDRM